MLALLKQPLPLDASRVEELLARVLGPTADEALKNRLLRLLLETAVTGAEQPAALLGSPVSVSADHPILRRLAQSHMPAIVGINDTTRDRIRRGLLRVIAEGGTLRQQVNEVQRVFREASTSRALTVARTESTIFYHAGGHQQMVESGARSHIWLSSRDARVRETHRVADGQCRGINEAFDVGTAKLMHPGDPSGPIEEIVNCRCSTAPQVGSCGSRSTSESERSVMWKRAIRPLEARERLALRTMRALFREQRSATLAVIAEMTR